jgi:tetratricopeptide (TPR) repeat protein
MPQTFWEEEGWLPDSGDYLAETLEREIARLTRVSERRAKVMVVDDMQTMRLLLTQALRGTGFSQVVRAADGETALHALREENCDLALVDWNMPRMDGLELLDQVRSDADLCDLVFIMVTGETLDQRVIQAAEEKQDAYLTKPISPEKLTRRLGNILEKRLTMARARQLSNQGKVEAAIEQVMTAAHNNPRAHWPLLGLGELLVRHERWEDARRCYQRLLQINPEVLSALVSLGRIEEKLGQVEAGRLIYQQALAANPLFLKAYDALAESLAAEGDYKGALAALKGALMARGTENAGRQEIWGRLHYQLGDYAAAEAAFAKALALKPRRNVVKNNLALGRSRLGQNLLAEALPALQKAVETGATEQEQTERVDAQLLLGATHLRRGDLKSAARVFAQMENPHRWPGGKPPFKPNHLHREVGGVYLGANLAGEAHAHFVKSMRADLDDAENYEAIREACRLAGRPELAQSAQEEAGRLQDQAVEACSTRGLALVKRGQFADALAEYQKGLALDPQAGRLQFNLAKVYYRLKQPAESFRAMIAAAKLGFTKQDWELLVEVARFLVILGRQEQATALLRQIQGKAPDYQEAAKALAEIEKAAPLPEPEEGTWPDSTAP